VALQSSTQFRRSGQRDDRRRRLLADDVSGPQVRGALRRGASVMPDRRSQNYGDASFMDEQLRVTDLIPRRLTTFMLLMLAGVTCVVGLETLYAWMPELAPLTREDGRVAAFDLDGEGSLAVWFSSVTLLLAAVATLIVYYVRRHKTDDYQGRYRIWLVAAACWTLMSMDETASLHEGFKEMMTHITGTRLLGDGSLWWAIPYFFLLGVIGSRLLVDMRKCILSSASLATAAVCYLVAVAAQLQWIMPETGAKGVMLEEGAEMTGNLFLLTAMALHARHVILDAEGLLHKNGEPEEDAWDEMEDELVDEWVKIDSPHKTLQPVLERKEQRRARKRSTTAAPESEHDASSRQALTKREKKAMRKRLIRKRMERERNQRKSWN